MLSKDEFRWPTPQVWVGFPLGWPGKGKPLMSDHKFKIGSTVFLQRTIYNRDAEHGPYEITKQLPERGGEFQYQIRNLHEPHERVARENELSTE